MDSYKLDNVDRGILHALQEDARNNSASDIAEKVDVAPNTVRNRIKNLENADVIDGYIPHINYEQAEFQLRVEFVCTVPVSDRRSLAEKSLDTEGVVQVTEILSGRDNLSIEVVGSDSDELTTIASQLEDLGCKINDERFIKNTRVQPFDHFGFEVVDGTRD
ncbi:Lrp/AsnC family transcriptional regulator [Natrialbaceae archaeon A-arb3/5]